MKKGLLFGGALSLAILSACGSGDSKDWSDDQKKAVTDRCLTMLEAGNSSTDGTVEDFCDCMTDKTTEKFTPVEAEALSGDDYKKILEDCNYSW